MRPATHALVEHVGCVVVAHAHERVSHVLDRGRAEHLARAEVGAHVRPRVLAHLLQHVDAALAHCTGAGAGWGTEEEGGAGSGPRWDKGERRCTHDPGRSGSGHRVSATPVFGPKGRR